MDVPTWLNRLLQSVTHYLVFYGEKNLFGYRAAGLNGQYWVSIFPIPSEIYGGQYDGKRVVDPFRIEISPLVREFDLIPTIIWDTDKREVTVHGLIDGNDVMLKIQEIPPDDQPADHQIDVTKGIL